MTNSKITTVSAKGQVVLPKATRDEMGWEPGVKLRVQKTPDGVLLSAVGAFPATTTKHVFGCLRFKGPAKTFEEMDAAIFEEARRRA